MFKLLKLTNSPFAQLLSNPQQFDFFQAVRLIEWTAARHRQVPHEITAPTAEAHSNAVLEAVRFQAAPSLCFPVNAISRVASAGSEQSTYFPITLQTTFHGLFGPSGLLPHFYTELIIQRLQIKDTALKDFLDLFNHRLLTLFYRSWTKHRFYINYEHARGAQSGHDLFTHGLQCLVGQGTAGLQERSSVPDAIFLFYAGFFAQQRRSASVLQSILADYFAVRVAVQQFQGKWLAITAADCSRLTSPSRSVNNFNQLGRNTVLGQRAWDCQYHFRIRLGPLRYEQFKSFLPLGNQLTALVAITRRYVGVGLNFDVQLVLKAHEVPRCQLGRQGKIALGWNAWLRTKPCIRDAEDTILPIANLIV